MRIEKVSIYNINSLAGRFDIDFTDGKYSEGLFAITGPSGAGKTTVLDAICLALYGKTPRIDTISETQDEIMSKNRDECSAEAVFVSRGKRYKASFSHKRAGGAKPFRQVKREITEYIPDGGIKIIASMIKEADDKIEEIMGLTYEQFTRSIMLAQFQFAEFLKSDSNDRAAILEQVSDMGIYREISAAVYERAKSERSLSEEIRIKIKSLPVMDGAQLKQLENERESLSSSIASHNRLRGGLTACKNTAEKIAKYKTELIGFQRGTAVIKNKLEQHKKSFEIAEADEKKLKTELSSLRTLLKTVRDLDGKAGLQKENIARLDKEIKSSEAKVLEYKKNIMALFLKYVPDADSDELRRLYNACDPGEALRAGAKAELEGAEAVQNGIRGDINKTLLGKDEVYWRQRTGALRTLLPLTEAYKEKQQAEEQLVLQREAQKKLLEQSAGLEAKEKEITDKLTWLRLEERFGQERRNLESGKPCPLCGATEHPGADKAYDKTLLNETQKRMDETVKQKNTSLQELADNRKDISDLEKKIKEKTAVLNTALSTEGLSKDPGEIKRGIEEAEKIMLEYASLLTKLDAAKNDVIKLTERIGGIEIDVASVKNGKQLIGEIEKQTEEKRAEKEEARKLFDQLTSERKRLFADKDTDAEETKAALQYDNAQQKKDDCRELKEKASRELEQNGKDIDRTKAYINTEGIKLEVSYADVSISMAEAQNAPRSADGETAALADGFLYSLKETAGSATQSVDKFGDLIEALNALITKETALWGAVGQKLDTNAQNAIELNNLKKDEAKQSLSCAKWDRLNLLIGSAEGDKFSRMAQGYTFEALLRYANACLRRMTDRYILVRDTSNGAKPLELCVADNYQAGDTRPVSNLSGGESFIVSMALALGMSEMSSGKTRIDSLFIDEGFASLDEDYLEAALQTLSSLGNREGKLVGVISHVGALKERIDAQIEVKKLSGGRSTLSGPGVTAIGE